MKILLDECLPLDFRHSFPQHEVHTAEWAGLKGAKNGELLKAAEAAGYDVLLTVDHGMQHQQRPLGRRLAMDKWRPMLHRYRIESLPMTDFVRPYGKHIGMPPELKAALFTEAVSIINSRKVLSISISVNHAAFRDSVPVQVYREAVSPYTSAFLFLARLNTVTADHNNFPDRIAYLFDETRSFAEQIRIGHSLVKGWEKTHGAKVVRTGALAFDSDDNVSALQAADLIAWSARRKLSGDGLLNEFLPLNEVLRERFLASGARASRSHVYEQVKDEMGARMMENVRTDAGRHLRDAVESLRSLTESEGEI